MHQLLLFRFWVFAEHTPSGALGHPLLSGSASIDGIKHSRETTAVHCWASSNYLRASKNLGLPPPTPLRSLVCGTHRLYFEVLGVRAHPLLPGFRICQNALPFGFSHPPAPFRVLGFRTQPLLWLAAAAAPFKVSGFAPTHSDWESPAPVGGFGSGSSYSRSSAPTLSFLLGFSVLEPANYPCWRFGS